MHTKKEKESKYSTKECHQATGWETKRKKKKITTERNTKWLTKFQ